MCAPIRRDGYANAGAGGVNDLGMIWFLQIIGGKMNSISYRGSAPALTDTVGGVVPVIFDNFPSSLPYLKSNHLRALVITGPARNPRLPDVPTFAEQGYKDYDVTAWYGVVAPAACPTTCATSWRKPSRRPCATRPRRRKWRKPAPSRWATRRPSSVRRFRPSATAGRA